MNSEVITKQIELGFKGRSTDNIGVEIEHFIVDRNTKKCIGYTGGVGDILNRISPFFDSKYFSEGFLIALSNSKFSITLEPAAQIEISITPQSSISAIDEIYSEFLDIIKPYLEDKNAELITYGYIINDKVDNLEMIPKKRYRFMDEYFKQTGLCGRNMMRGTASTQVSIDFSDEEDCALKLRKACVLGPLFALISDNSPVFEKEIYKKNTLRTYIWNNVDKDRCGVFPCMLDKNFKISDYADYLCSKPSVFMIKDGESVYTGDKKTNDIYKNGMTVQDAEHVMSMFFPDVRLKQYLEIRSADSMPIEYSLAYAAFIKGIFKENYIPGMDFEKVSLLDIENAKKEIIENGFNAKIYGSCAKTLLINLYKFAEEHLQKGDGKYLKPLKEIIVSGRTLKERYYDK